MTYPGGLAVLGAKADFKRSDDNQGSEDYALTFDLEVEYENETGDSLLWALYMVEGEKLSQKMDPECKLVIDAETKPGETHYWYSNDNETPSSEFGKSCTLSSEQLTALEQKTNMIAYGSLGQTSGTAQKITASEETTAGNLETDNAENVTGKIYDPKGTTNNPLSGRTLDTKNNPTKYYYLVVQYPNENDTQNEGNEQKKIAVSLKYSENSAKASVMQ